MDGGRSGHARFGDKRTLGRFGRIGLALLLAIVTSVGPLAPTPPVAHAASFTVTTTADAPHSSPLNGNCTSTLPGNPCTLRAAFQAANFLGGGPHTIAVPAGTYTLTVTGPHDELAANGTLDVAPGVNLTVLGAGAASTIIQAGPTPGSGIGSVLFVLPPGELTVKGATIRHGNGVGVALRENGNGVPDGRLTLDRVVLSDNTGTHEGGAILSDGLLRITNSAIINNSAPNGAAIYQNTLNPAVGAVELTNVTISGNVDTGSHGQNGIIENIDSSAPFLLRNVTIVNNQGFALSGIHYRVSNSIIAGNSEGCHASGNVPGFPPPITSAGHNLTGTGEGCDDFAQPGDLINADPKLGPLRDNGGGIPSRALLPGSPAIDAGNPAAPGSGANVCPTTDQRGIARPQDGDDDGTGRCDIGAVELPRFEVTSTDDAVDAKIGNLECEAANDACTLRAAIQEANALGGALIGVPAGTYKLTRAGAGEDAAASGDLDITQGLTLVSKGATVNGGGLDRVFDLRNGAQAVLSGLTVERGDPGSGQAGGGIRVGGTGTRLALSESLVRGNTAGSGAGIANGARLDLTNVTLSGNLAVDRGGGLLTSDDPAGESSLVNVTIADNSANNGGGHFRGTGAFAVFRNTLLANNAGGNCAGTITSTGHNLDSANTCNLNSTQNDGDLTFADPKLGPLQDNGGPSHTHALLTGSAAIDRGSDTGCPKIDQRREARPKDGNGDGTSRCDIGAFEVQSGSGGTVGAFSLAPAQASVAVGQRHTTVLTWTVPPPKTWHSLKSVRVRLREAGDKQGDDGRPDGSERNDEDRRGPDHERVALQFQWDQDTNAIREVEPRTGRLGPPLAFGSDAVIASARAELHLKASSIKGGGPSAPSVDLTMSLGFRPPTKGRTFAVEVAATDDGGASQGFERAGTIAVAR